VSFIIEVKVTNINKVPKWLEVYPDKWNELFQEMQKTNLLLGYETNDIDDQTSIVRYTFKNPEDWIIFIEILSNNIHWIDRQYYLNNNNFLIEVMYP
jgi:hypothetical protein